MTENPLNLVWITEKHPPNRGGMAQSSARLVNHLRDNGHAVTVLHLSTQPRIDPAESPAQDRLIAADPLSPAEPERLFWHYHKRLKNARLVGFGGGLAGYFATLWATWLNSHSTVLFRGNDFDRNIHNEKRAAMTHFILQHAGTVGAVTQEMTHRISTLREKNTLYTPNSIHMDEWTLFEGDKQKIAQWREENITEAKPVIAMFGELKSKKGLGLALSLFTSFQFRDRACLLTVGRVSEAMSNALAEGCGEHWIHVPFRDREKLPVYYGVADIVFIPSYYDGMPNVLLEAMASDRVVVASRAGAMPDVIKHGHNGFLFDIADVNDAARVLLEVMEMEPEHLNNIRQAAVETVEQSFTPENETRIIENAVRAPEA